MADPHDLNSRVELLKRQNRRLKVALSIVTALLLMATCASTWQAVRAATAERHARWHAEKAAEARVAEERALQMVEDAREQTESQNDVEP